jgi:hypothetical protein
MTRASSSAPTVKTENLMLDEPAFRTNISSVIASPNRFVAVRAPGVGG